MTGGTALLDALPVAVYTTDAEGRITFYNEAAAELWGHRPEIGRALWCGAWKLFRPDGQVLAHEDCPMAVCVREGRVIRGVEAVLERPDGSRVSFTPYPTPLRDAGGRVTGGINLLVDTTELRERDIESARLAAIVSGSDDVIVSKTLEGIVTSWNDSAARVFGYEAAEMIGESILRIVPERLQEEEADILGRLRRGERIEHFDTVRLTKDGREVDVSITVSPLRDRLGNIVGASKVGRDITERKQAEKLQKLLFEELNHRVKNTLATIQAIAGQSLRRSPSSAAFVASFNGRVQALARAHDLLVRGKIQGVSMADLVRDQVVAGGDSRITCSGPFVMLDQRIAVQLALVLHELATNARKYGALTVPEGGLDIDWHVRTREGRDLLLTWRETGVPDVEAPDQRGFGSQLIERTLEANGGETTVRYEADGICCHIKLPLPDEIPVPHGLIPGTVGPAAAGSPKEENGSIMNGKRILLIEDEALVAMEIETDLISMGCEVVGPAANIPGAKRLIDEQEIDAALVDANLAGKPVDELAAALTRRGVPFAFATGYGREGLPRDFQHVPVLTKPFGREQMLAVVQKLLDAPDAESAESNVVRLQR